MNNKYLQTKENASDIQHESIEALSIVTIALLFFTIVTHLLLLIQFSLCALIHLSRPAVRSTTTVLRFFAILGEVVSHELSELRLNQELGKRTAHKAGGQLYAQQPLKHIAAFIFTGAALIFVLAGFQSVYIAYSLVSAIENAYTQGFTHLKQGVQLARTYDYSKSALEFKLSEYSFEYARDINQTIPPIIAHTATYLPFIGTKIQDAQEVLLAGMDLSKAGAISMEFLRQRRDVPSIEDIQKLLSDVSPLAMQADSSLQKIHSSSIPSHMRESFMNGVNAVHDIRMTVEMAVRTMDAITDSMGSRTLRRYLILFQNNAELRPTGGFIGSYALIDIANGEIKRIEIPPGGPYDLRATFREHLNPPEPLRLIASQWEFQDANWWADFPTSAQKLLWFYEKAQGPTVDGVIAINASLLPRLLALVGPMKLEKYNKTLSDANVLTELQRAVELEYDRADNKPKQIIADTFPLLVGTLSRQDSNTLYRIFPLLIDAISRKDIQFYFRNQSYQLLAQQFGIAGEMHNVSPDYTMLVSANIGGAKTDSVITSVISQLFHVNEDGSIIGTINLKRKHNGTMGDQFTGLQHNDYLRFYVPLGSQLISADGFGIVPLDALKKSHSSNSDDAEVSLLQQNSTHIPDMNSDTWNELGRSVFAGWLFTKPSTTSELTITYRLPYTLDDFIQKDGRGMYALLLQRQSGSTIVSYTVTFEIPHRYAVEWNDNQYCTTEYASGKHVCIFNEFNQDQLMRFNLRHQK